MKKRLLLIRAKSWRKKIDCIDCSVFFGGHPVKARNDNLTLIFILYFFYGAGGSGRRFHFEAGCARLLSGVSVCQVWIKNYIGPIVQIVLWFEEVENDSNPGLKQVTSTQKMIWGFTKLCGVSNFRNQCHDVYWYNVRTLFYIALFDWLIFIIGLGGVR